jgi:ABC-type glycerol-3-phosphate transport system substrate-binding protein
MRKRIAILLAALACVVGLAACGSGSTDTGSPAPSRAPGY